MDFVEINFEAIRQHVFLISPNQPIEDYKNVYKSVFESFDKFCQNKKNMIKGLEIPNLLLSLYH